MTTIRRYDPTRDVQALRDCVMAQQDFHRRLEPSWPTGEAVADAYLAYLQQECAAHNGSIFIAEVADEPAGFVCIVAAAAGASPDDPAPFAWVHDIYVKPEHRCHGIASALMAEAERFAREHGARVVRLGVLNRNVSAVDFYINRGFREYTHVLTKRLDE